MDPEKTVAVTCQHTLKPSQHFVRLPQLTLPNDRYTPSQLLKSLFSL